MLYRKPKQLIKAFAAALETVLLLARDSSQETSRNAWIISKELY
jgi:hypothetical protein